MPIISESVTATAKVVDTSDFKAPITITAIPGSGNTSKVEFSTTPGAAVAPASATWQAWGSGTVSSTTTDVFIGRLTALRFTRVSGSSTDTYEVVA